MALESFALGLLIKSMFSFFKKKPPQLPAPSEPVEAKTAPLAEFTQEEFEKIKFKARIAFVDDEDINHIKRLQRDGYNITHWEDIENIDDFIKKNYHVVVLDIQGVGKNISTSSEGWGILKYLKNTYPHIVVIMFTGADWSITKFKQQAEQADDFIGKDSDYLDFKYNLDAAIKKSFSPKYHLEINKYQTLKVIKSTESPEEILNILNHYGKDKETALQKVKEKTDNREVIKTATEFLNMVKSFTELLS